MDGASGPLCPHGSLARRLIDATPDAWRAYTEHPFVARLADGTLPEPAFRHYLVQDYLFLLNFGRCYALAVYKSETLEDMRGAAATLDALINEELRLHVEYCQGWALTEADMAAVEEDTANLAYTRFVLERGMAGDLLDLLTVLLPCVVGYGEIGRRLSADPATRLDGNPYRAWIEMYAGEGYQAVAAAAVSQIERVADRRAGPGGGARFPALVRDFGRATRLEADFWQMGLNAAP